MINDQTIIQAPIPEHIPIEQTSDGLLFSYRWFSPAYIFIACFAIAWDAFLVFWYTMATSQNAPLMMLLFPIVHILVGFGITDWPNS